MKRGFSHRPIVNLPLCTPAKRVLVKGDARIEFTSEEDSSPFAIPEAQRNHEFLKTVYRGVVDQWKYRVLYVYL